MLMSFIKGATRCAFVIFVAVLCVIVVSTQEAIPLLYGDFVTGEITDSAPEVHYTFFGEAGDVIAAEMLSVDRSLQNSLSEPVLKLLDPSGELLVNTTLAVPVDDTLLVAELPVDGEYTLIASRDVFVPELATGGYTLELMLVLEITESTPVENTITNDDYGHYYVVRTDGTWSLEYERLDGAYAPQITVNILNPERGGLEMIGGISGSRITQAVIGDFEPDETYVIIVRESHFDFQFGEQDALYSLNLIARSTP